MKQSNRTIVCLCGSTKFKDAYAAANLSETLAGKIVLSVGGFLHAGDPITPKQKEELDLLHFNKIELADEVLILNVDGYIGESTRGEIALAVLLHKRLRFLEPVAGEAWLENHTHELGAMAPYFSRLGLL
jgi:hypothetical protein